MPDQRHISAAKPLDVARLPTTNGCRLLDQTPFSELPRVCVRYRGAMRDYSDRRTSDGSTVAARRARSQLANDATRTSADMIASARIADASTALKIRE